MERKHNASPSTITCFKWAHMLEAASHTVTAGTFQPSQSIREQIHWSLLVWVTPGFSFRVCGGVDGYLPKPWFVSIVQFWIQGDALWQVLARPWVSGVVWHPPIPWTLGHPTGAPPSEVCQEKIPKQTLKSTPIVFEFPPVYRPKGGNPYTPHPILHRWFSNLCRHGTLPEMKT